MIVLMIIAIITVGVIINNKIDRLAKLIESNKVVAAAQYTFKMYWAQTLTQKQTTLIAGQMINKFSPACRPMNISVSPGTNTSQVTFGTPCMTAKDLTDIGNRLMADNHETNTVSNVVEIGI